MLAFLRACWTLRVPPPCTVMAGWEAGEIFMDPDKSPRLCGYVYVTMSLWLCVCEQVTEALPITALTMETADGRTQEWRLISQSKPLLIALMLRWRDGTQTNKFCPTPLPFHYPSPPRAPGPAHFSYTAVTSEHTKVEQSVPRFSPGT